MPREIRIAVIGCGFFAQNHLHAWQDLADDGARLVAVCDIDPAKAETAGRDFRVPHYGDAAAMIAANRLDLVDIVTRHETHRSLAELAVSKRLSTIVQKPFAPSWDDCVAIVEAAERAGVWLAVHENFRFQAPMQAVSQVIRSGEIGAPSWARIAFRTGFDVYKTQPYFYDEERLAIADVGIHLLDLARFFLGDVEQISCETQRRNPKVRAEDTATMLLRHASGAVSVVECTYESRRLPDAFPETLLMIEGSKGAVVMDAGCRMTITSGSEIRTQHTNTPLLPWTTRQWHVAQQSVLVACGHFLDCLQRGVPADTSGEDNLRTYALVDAAYRAADEKRAVAPLQWRGGRRA